MRLIRLAFIVLGLGIWTFSAHTQDDFSTNEFLTKSYDAVNPLLSPGMGDATVAQVAAWGDTFTFEGVDEYGHSVLHLFVWLNDDLKVTEFLLAQGLDVHARDNYGYTPLISAGGGRNPDIIDILVAYGADVNAKSNKGITALMNAASRVRYGRPAEIYIAIMQRLLHHGADIHAADNDGRTALDYAKDIIDTVSVKRNQLNLKTVKADQQRVIAFIESEMEKRKP